MAFDPNVKLTMNTKRLSITVQARFENDTPYAAAVHEGYVRENGSIWPGRPWTKTALESFDAEATFAKLFVKHKGDADKAFREMAQILQSKFQAEIRAIKWQWPQGESPRDIVDTGELYYNQKLVLVRK